MFNGRLIKFDRLQYCKAEQIKRIGIKSLRRNKRLRLLWMEYEAAAFFTRTYSMRKNIHTSAVEAGVMRRELLLGAITGRLYDGIF